MGKQKTLPVSNLQQLRFKAAQKLADWENGEMSNSDAKAFGTLAGVILNSIKIESVHNHFIGITKQIDFLTYGSNISGNNSPLLSEIAGPQTEKK